MGRVTYRQMSGPEGLLAHLTPFEGHSMRGIKAEDWSGYWTGRLDAEESARFQADRERGLRYIVISYSTPIAWVCNDGTVYNVAQRFSVTTSKGQGYVRAWLGAATPGTDTYVHHVNSGYRVPSPVC